MRLGYCCINQTLRDIKPTKDAVFCGRSLIKRTFTLAEAGKRALANCRDLLTILEWNEAHDIRCFRISSDLFPRYTCSEFGYHIDDLAEANQIRAALKAAGDYAYEHDHWLSFHPGPYTTLASPNPTARDNAIKEFEYHSLLADMIDPSNRMYIPINIHVGGSYGGDYIGTASRFIDTYESLSSSARRRIVLENDDKPNGWSVQRLYEYIFINTCIPITFDAHHWLFCHDDNDMHYDFLLARSTWGCTPMQVHYSQSPTAAKLIPAHSEYYRDAIPSFISDYDNLYVHLECKQKELALLKYRADFGMENINTIQESNDGCKEPLSQEECLI